RHRLGEQELLLRRSVEDDCREHACSDEASRREDRGEGAPARRRDEHGPEQADGGGAEQRERRREREPVDVRCRDRGRENRHGDGPVATGALPVGKEWSVIDAGQTESASRIATSGTTSASSVPPRSGESARTDSPIGPMRSRWSTPEMSRSVYIAASTI